VYFHYVGASDDEVDGGQDHNAVTVVRPKLVPLVLNVGMVSRAEVTRKPSVVFTSSLGVTNRSSNLTNDSERNTMNQAVVVGHVVLPSNTTETIGGFLGTRLTKTKGHHDTARRVHRLLLRTLHQ